MGSELLLPVVLLVMGFLLLGLEVIVLPGVGLVGLLGLFSLGSGCYILFVDVGEVAGFIGLGVSLVGSVVGVRLFLRSRAAQTLVLDEAIMGTATEADVLAGYVGRQAETSGPLRPSGVVVIDDERLDAVLQDGSYLDSGVLVDVVGQAHGQLHVVAFEVPTDSSDSKESFDE